MNAKKYAWSFAFMAALLFGGMTHVAAAQGVAVQNSDTGTTVYNNPSGTYVANPNGPDVYVPNPNSQAAAPAPDQNYASNQSYAANPNYYSGAPNNPYAQRSGSDVYAENSDIVAQHAQDMYTNPQGGPGAKWGAYMGYRPWENSTLFGTTYGRTELGTQGGVNWSGLNGEWTNPNVYGNNAAG